MADFPNPTSASDVWGITDQYRAQAGSNWPAVTDPYFKNVSLLLSGDGVDGSADSIITDSSNNNFAITIAGDTKSTGFNPYLTGWSNYFDGAGDYLGLPVASNTGTWGAIAGSLITIEFWFYTNTIQAITAFNTGIFGHMPALSQNGRYVILLLGTGTTSTQRLNFGYTTSPSTVASVISTQTMAQNQWHHCAITIDATTATSSTIKLYINGQGETFTGQNLSTHTSDPGNEFRIGNANDGNQSISGYISNFRIVRGSLVYTTNFTPSTTPLTAIAGTSLLTCTSNRFQDLSTNNHTITGYGDTKVTSFNPYNLTNTSKYGSAYFDGNGDYLSVPDSSAFVLSADFTIETWVYITSLASVRTIVAQWPGISPTNCAFSVEVTTSGSLQLVYGIGATNAVVGTTSLTLAINSWNHIAITRQGTAVRFFINGSIDSNTPTVSGGFNDSNANPTVGLRGDSIQPMLGYISNLSIVKGTALYTSNFTPPSAPLTPVTNTSLLTCQYKTAPTNDMVLDSSANNLVVTTTGNATQGSFSPYADRWSNYFDGTADYLSVPDNVVLQLGTVNFTIEAWVYRTSTASPQGIIYQGAAGLNYQARFGILWNGTTWVYRLSSNGQNFNIANDLSMGSDPGMNTWIHLVLVRNGNTFTPYVNGVAGTTATSADTINNYLSPTLNIGTTLSSSEFFTGYISNLRIVKGTALYTTNFTPSTTPLTAVAGTSLLTCTSNRFQDLSINNHTITPAGDTKVQRFSPFSPSSTYVGSILGGSTYFDGTGDILSIPDNPALQLGSSNFTIDFYIYPVTLTGNQWLLGKGDGASASGTMISWMANNGNFDFYYGSSTLTLTKPTLVVGAWQHVAIVRNGQTITLYFNGVSTSSANLPAATTALNTGGSNPLVIGQYSSGAVNCYISSFRVVKGTAVYTANFTPPKSPVTAISGTSLLIDSTNGAIVDHTGTANLENIGDVKVSTVQSKWGSSSMYFDGTDYLTAPTNSAFSFGTGDFTVECWVYLNSKTGYPTFAMLGDGVDATPVQRLCWWALYYDNNTASLMFNRYAPTNVPFSFSWVPNLSQWYHVAIARSGTSLRAFINGIQIGTTQTTSQDYSAANATPLHMGRFIANGGGVYYLNGYIDDLRITKGIARYTSTFTPSSVSPKQ